MPQKASSRAFVRLVLVMVLANLILTGIEVMAEDGSKPVPVTMVQTAAIPDVVMPGVWADGVAENAIKKAIHAQLDAIRRRDGKVAWGLLTPGYQKRAGTEERFLEMVRHDYWPLYTHRQAVILDSQSLGAARLETVRMTGRAGRPALMIFRLEPQDNGGWLIDSIVVLESDGQPV